MILYAESSAIVAWLFGQARGEDVRRALEAADDIVTSALTRLECLRTIVRVETTGVATAAEAARVSRAFAQASLSWRFVDLATEVLERAAVPFPGEPVRSLDAIHLATLLLVRSVAADVEVLALDARVRDNALRLGVSVQPA